MPIQQYVDAFKCSRSKFTFIQQRTVAQLLQAHPSVPYNPAIANVFFRAGLIEAWGRGTLRMIDDCVKDHVPAPIFKYDFSGFIVDFTFKKILTPIIGSEKSSEKIMELIKQQTNITIKELSERIGISTRAIEKNIKALKQNNKIIRKGSDKLGVWEILTQI